jgi:hypothetical protein
MMTKKKPAGAKLAKTKSQQEATKPKATKLARLEAMLRHAKGATIEHLAKSLGWQSHSVRGAIAGSLKKRGV